MTEQTLFSRIISRELPFHMPCQNELVTAFRDLAPGRPRRPAARPIRTGAALVPAARYLQRSGCRAGTTLGHLMQPVPTEYPGLPRTPARHPSPNRALRSALLCGLLCGLPFTFGGCTNERSGTSAGTDLFLSDPASAAPGTNPNTTPDTLPSLAVTLQGERLRVDWRLDSVSIGADTRLHLELVDARDADRAIDELRPALTGTVRRGHALLSVRAHDLAWHAVALRARWTDAAGTTLATSGATALAPLLGARAQRLDPDDPDARLGAALAYGIDGAVLVIADPTHESLLLHLPDGDGTLDGAERVRVIGLASARPGTIDVRASAWAQVLAVSWRDMDGTSMLAVFESDGDGLHRTVWRQRLAAPVRDLVLATHGRQLDLVDATGRHRRLLRTAARWRESVDPDRAVFDAIAVDPAGEPVGLVDTPEGAALLRGGRQQRALPGTVGLQERAVAQATRVGLDPDGLHLAIATLERLDPAPLPSTVPTPAHAVPTLRLFSRTDVAQPWRAGPTLRRPVTGRDARTTLRFGTRPAAIADTLLWHWYPPHDGFDTPGVADLAGTADASGASDGTLRTTRGHGLAILTTRAIAQAFGDADRTDRGAGAWRVAFSLPDDGVRGDAAHLPVAATLSVDGTVLAFTSGSSPGTVVLID